MVRRRRRHVVLPCTTHRAPLSAARAGDEVRCPRQRESSTCHEVRDPPMGGDPRYHRRVLRGSGVRYGDVDRRVPVGGTDRVILAKSPRYSISLVAKFNPLPAGARQQGQRRPGPSGSGPSCVVGDTGMEPVTSSVSGKRATAAPIAHAAKRGGYGIRTRVYGFAGRCLATRPTHRPANLQPRRALISRRSTRAAFPSG